MGPQPPISVSEHSDMPIYRQIVTQLTFMIEMGQLGAGDRLPGSRMLADNLGINRNTVARAYGDLRAAGLVESRGRGGMVVLAPTSTQPRSEARDTARETLQRAVDECLQLGLSPTEIGDLALNLAVTQSDSPRVYFVECNDDRADYFADELTEKLGVRVTPLVLDRFDPSAVPADLVLTTFFHLAQVRGLMSDSAEVVAIVVAPHIRTLMQIADVPPEQKVGLWYNTAEQAASVRDSLSAAGITDVTMLDGTSDDELAGLDVVVIPSETAELADRLAQRVRVIEFGNVLDDASVRMVREVLRDLRSTNQPSA